MRKLRFRYSWRQFLGDGFGGVIAALIALPYGLAMASLMGLPPVLGLFTSIITSPITAFLGRNPVLIGGTASATVPFIAGAVKAQGVGGAAKISIVAAVFLMVFSVLRLGRHIQRVPQTVVSGFSCGVGGLMIILQLETILGLASPVTKSGGAPIQQFFSVLGRLDGTRWEPLLLGAVVITISQAVSMWSKRIPAPLLAIGVAVLVSLSLNLHEKEVGTLPLEIPPLAGFSWTPKEVLDVLTSGFGLAFVVAVNVLITSRVVEHFRGRHVHGKKSDADAELGAYGIANICAGIFGAPVSVGIPARSLANVRCGGTTRMSNIMHALILILLLSVGNNFVAHIPVPALAGVTAWMGFCLLDWSTWRRLPRMRRYDAAAFLVTAIAVLCVNAVLAVALGCSVYGLRWIWMRFFAPPEAAPQQIPAESR
jgi:SulP family sulfate permease